MEWKYLSDEELEQLVKDIEEKPLCPAPEYLKPMILNKVEAYDKSVHNKRSSGMQLFAYSVKIMAAAVAAAVVILTVPVMDKAQSLDHMEQSAQAELERMQDRAADREYAQQQDRIEDMGKIDARRATEEEREAYTARQVWGIRFFFGGWGEQPEVKKLKGGSII